MLWNRRYLIKSYIQASLWLMPFFALLAYWVISRTSYGIGAWLLQTGRIDETTAFFGATIVGARSVLDTVVTANLSFLVFTFGSLLVAIQVAGGQLTPRIIATTLLRDNTIRFTVSYFIFTFLFAMRVLGKMGGETVHQLNTFIAAVLGLGSVVVFLYLIDYAARFLRPVSMVQRVGESGIKVLESVYPEPSGHPSPAEPARRLSSPERTVVNAGASGVVLAVDLEGLVAQACKAGGMIEFVPQVGDFVAVDEPLFRLYGGAGAIADRLLRGAVALGSERTIEQDPTFAFRILVDIAIKALSPAINDPTTAVLAIDQLHRLLRRVGLRKVRGEEVFDAEGELRLIFRTPNWEDFVHLTCIEIRHCGAGSIQIMRRMRSMLENLMQTLPPQRHAELRRQLELLDRTIEGNYAFAEDIEIAGIPDSQGLGGSLGIQAAVHHHR
ncbi:MAG: DUF2254 domain-containing protein [Deltaproteobacteria bacterium]|nr:DUF2254 domain-containing protein [Deltaproteobacteria bacterium]